MYTFRFDDDTGILHCKITGFWTVDLAERYVIEQQSHWNDARRRVGHLLLLTDGSESKVQSPEVSQRVQAGRRSLIKSPKDRAAIVVGSNLGRMQTERTIESDQIRVFTSVAEAEQWLSAESQSRNAA
jgi:hypothetical protein